MWVEIKKVNSLAMAEMWKELYEGEGIPARVRPQPGQPRDTQLGAYSLLVPQDKAHLIEEITRQL